MKSSSERIQVMENETITNQIHVTAQKTANSTEKRTTLDVGVQTMEVPSVHTNRSSPINQATSMHEENRILKLNQEKTTSMIRENNVIRTPYRHSNHKRKYLKQSKYQYHSGHERITYLLKNIDTSAIQYHDNHSPWKCNSLQKFE